MKKKIQIFNERLVGIEILDGLAKIRQSLRRSICGLEQVLSVLRRILFVELPNSLDNLTGVRWNSSFDATFGESSWI